MALTRDFEETIHAQAQQDPALADRTERRTSHPWGGGSSPPGGRYETVLRTSFAMLRSDGLRFLICSQTGWTASTRGGRVAETDGPLRKPVGGAKDHPGCEDVYAGVLAMA